MVYDVIGAVDSHRDKTKIWISCKLIFFVGRKEEKQVEINKTNKD